MRRLLLPLLLLTFSHALGQTPTPTPAQRNYPAFVEGAARCAIEIHDAAAQVGRVSRSRAAGTGHIRTNLGRTGEASNVEAPANATSRRSLTESG